MGGGKGEHGLLLSFSLQAINVRLFVCVKYVKSKALPHDLHPGGVAMVPISGSACRDRQGLETCF